MTSGTGTTINPTAPAAASVIYVFQAGDPAGIVSIFSANATGTASPLMTLALPPGNYPASVTTDASGSLYVGCQGTMGDQVLVYPAGAAGNIAPTRAVKVPGAPFSITVDPSGILYVEGSAGTQGTVQVNAYSTTATGAAAPLTTLLPAGIQLITALATDSSGNLYVAGETPQDQGLISVYPPGASGSAAPTRTIQSPSNFGGLTLDTTGNLFATMTGPNSEILAEYSPAAAGNATPINTFTLSFPITDASFIGGVTRDARGNLYFVASRGVPGTNHLYIYTETIYTFAPAFTTTSIPVRSFSPSSSISLTLAVH